MIEWLAALDLLAGDCPTPTADGIAGHLFDTEHFTGNRGAYYEWRNSCLDQVIASRRGIPITLSILMIEVGRRLGVRLVGVGMPAHFLVGVADEDDVFYDPFDHGRRLDRDGARRRFDEVTGGQVTWDDRYLRPTPDRDIVVRMLNNLKGVCSARRRPAAGHRHGPAIGDSRAGRTRSRRDRVGAGDLQLSSVNRARRGAARRRGTARPRRRTPPGRGGCRRAVRPRHRRDLRP